MAGNILTYDSLKAYILDALNRKDPRVVDNLDNFIMQTERIAATVLNIEGTKVFADGFCTPGNAIIEKDNRWMNSYSFGINYKADNQTDFDTYTYLKLRTWSYCMQYWPNLKKTGLPTQYSDMEQGQIIIVPTPAVAYPFIWGYWAVPQLLGPSNSTNFMTTHNPQCLMYGAVMHANLFLQNYEEADKWEIKFNNSLGQVQSLDNRLVADGATKRDHT